MKYVIIQTILLLLSVIFLYYFSTKGYFLPLDSNGKPLWLNISLVMSLIFITTQALFSILITFIQKRLFFGKKEMPPIFSSLKWGMGIAICLIMVILLNVFHLLSIQWGLLIVFLIFIVLILIK